jgi:hypothetical protein
MSAVLSRWFTSYEEARDSRAAEGGYLLPYRHQFFVTTGEAILELGLDPSDADWELIGWDWVHPQNSEAWQRLKRKREAVIAAR